MSVQSRESEAESPCQFIFPSFQSGQKYEPTPTIPLDDDAKVDGATLPLPDTGTLASALGAAYVTPSYDLQGKTNVPFVLNVDFSTEQDVSITHTYWNSRNQNANNYWAAYLLEAFQGPKNQDGDPDVELTTAPFSILGVTVGPAFQDPGGSLIFWEVIQDYARLNGASPVVKEQDTVVHEIGHAVGNSGTEPVTQYPTAPSVYDPTYLNFIRTALRPWS
ncbi:MAG TPA: hypothetical protein VG406_03170 [Isosphaeraceae bacterium]|nr:hypothetical protein [Isosphaeraceae bacterium]